MVKCWKFDMVQPDVFSYHVENSYECEIAYFQGYIGSASFFMEET